MTGSSTGFVGAMRRWRAMILLGSTALFVLGIRSLPWRRWHLVLWAFALAVQVLLVILLRTAPPRTES